MTSDRLEINGEVFAVEGEANAGRFFTLRSVVTGARHELAWHDTSGWNLDRKPVRSMRAAPGVPR